MENSPADQSSPVPIVAIGASAGGLDAVSELLKQLSPTTGMAYIYIHRLDTGIAEEPTSESDLLAVLTKATAMPVVAAADKMPVQTNHVYVIVARSNQRVSGKQASQPEAGLEVIDGVLTQVIHHQNNALAGDLPIDRFFIALANRQHDGAIAILLSGSASDGTLGMRAIRAAGGLTFAQDETARFQGMTRSAIGEGIVDRVLSPTNIARALEQLSQQKAGIRQAAGANALESIDVGSDDVPEQQADGQKDDELSADADPSIQDSSDIQDGMRSSVALEQATDEDVQRIIQIIRKTTGTDFSHYKITTIRRRIVRRMLLFRFDILNEYAEYLRQHPEETRALYDDLLINVTTFFRDTDTMDYLQKVLIPQLIQTKDTHEPLRIWVPACSTGQEAYSIAILILEVLGERSRNLTIQLFATDLSEPAVAKARLGSYTRGEVMDVSPRRLQRFFTKVDDHYRINKAVRDLCVFAPHNLLKDPPFSRLDFVSCRNLLIYLDAQLQRKVIATFHYALNPNGYLLLGKSETVGASSSYFSAAESNYKLYARKNDVAGRALFDMNTRSGISRTVLPLPNRSQMEPKVENGTSTPAQQHPADPEPDGQTPRDETARTKASQTPRTIKGNRLNNNLDKTVDNLLSQYVPASVVVSADLDILQFRGSTGLFLEHASGRASLNLLKMARPALSFELRNVIHKAGQSGQPVRRSGLEVKVKNKTHYVAIEAVPFNTEADERLFLVLFEEVTAIMTADSDAADVRSQRIKQLEEELATLREDMRSVIEEQEAAHEELQSANEEIISSNEELQSINEELETGKEEIESTNEELLTINQELQVRNDQLSEANTFAEAIFGTIREATLVLTPDLRVKSANSVFYALFDLNEMETEGRLIYELSNRQWDIPELRSLLTDVATRDVQVQGYVLTYPFPEVGKKILSLNARRVVRQQEAILLAIEDITEHRRSQLLLEEREAWFHQIADNAPALIWVAGPDGRYTFLNKVWLDYTGQSPEDVVANGWARLLHSDDQKDYKEIYQTNFTQRNSFQAEYRLRRHDGNFHWMLENAQPTFSPDGQFTGFIGTAADVHVQKELNVELDRLVAERTEELTLANTRLGQTADQLQSVLNGVPASIMLKEAIFPNDDPNAPSPVDFTSSAFNQQVQESANEPLDAERANALLSINHNFKENGLFEAFVDVFTKGHLAYRELTFDTEDQSFCFAFYITQQVDKRGVVVTSLDITDRKLAEKQVQKTANALQAVLDNSPASIGLLQTVRTSAGVVTDFTLLVGNQRFAQFINQPLSQINKLRASQFIDQFWGQDTLLQLIQVVETGKPFYIEQPASDGWLGLSVTKQDDGIVMIGLDISTLRQMQEDQVKLLDQIKKSGETVEQLAILQQQVQARGELLRTSSHDLRGSLGVIQGAAGLLTFADTDEERAQMLDMLQRNVLETNRLINELLDFSRLESGQQEVQFFPFDAAEMLRKLGENVRPLVEGKGLELRVLGEETMFIEGDSLNVLRIAQNIMLNALKYTDRGSITLIWGDAGSNEWFFSVEDTGRGMDKDQANQLSYGGTSTGAQNPIPTPTLPHEPLLGSTSGEGIGLMIVRQLCTLLQGRLVVNSQLDLGSVFRVELPRHY